ncbi:MAG: DUF6364 family protein [Terriglobales bacterium]
MRNITVAVDEEVYRRAREVAARRDTSVSALVSSYLRTLQEREDDFERRRQDEIEIRKTITNFSAGDRLSRDELHRRR